MNEDRHIAIVTDSVCCVPRHLVDHYNIGIVPISFVINGQVYRDGVDITPREVYQLVAMKKNTPTTSSPSPGEFLEAYEEASKWADGIVVITICSDISMMCDSAMKAKELMQEKETKVAINVIDSRTAGGAEGFVVLAAAEAAAANRSLHQVSDAATSMITRVHMIGVLDTLYYLAKAGRIPFGKAVHLGTSLLKIKPILSFTHEGIGLLENARTKPKAVNRMLEIMEEQTKGKAVHVNIMHANVLEEAVALRKRIQSQFNCNEIFITDFAPTMGVQAGPGVVAIAFYI